ncbi:MAG: transglutaminase-like cysteine peptidase [Alphaproteobacteria bacterium]|nr:transglutaminase-like cysteine peptidase [Alphaproteobacteria bacterium]
MQRRGFLAALGAGALAGMTARPQVALAAIDDVSRPARRFPALYGTREYFIGDTVKKLPRARAATLPLDDAIAKRFARSLYNVIPVSNAGGTGWDSILDSARSLVPMHRMQLVNDFANRMPYVEDIDNYGMRDFWAKSKTFFEIGGDCEDFALAKYQLLERLGFHRNRMRIVLVVDEVRERQHAVLAVNLDGQAWMLDSLVRDVVLHNQAPQYRPTVSLSGPRLYLHVPPKA